MPHQSPNPQLRIEQITQATTEALAILEEYYEAVHVVRRDTPAALQKTLDECGSAMWLARLNGAVAGCVVLRPLHTEPDAGECKRLYVRPEARGHHIANRLMDVLEDFAHAAGTRWIYLDTHDGLKAAIALYRQRGYQPCPRYNDNPQATLFMRKNIS